MSQAVERDIDDQGRQERDGRLCLGHEPEIQRSDSKVGGRINYISGSRISRIRESQSSRPDSSKRGLIQRQRPSERRK